MSRVVSATSRVSEKEAITLAITGASGIHYSLRLLEVLVAVDKQVALLMSDAAKVVLKQEADYDLPESIEQQVSWFSDMFNAKSGQIRLYSKQDWFSPVASGSGAPKTMVVCPASGGTLSAIAHGASNNLIERAADVVLKERNKLILVPRETPYSDIHLENMLKLSRMGAVILPASPGFYQNPTTIQDLVDFVVARILDQLDIEQGLLPSWGL